MKTYPITIAGIAVELAWTTETSKRFFFRASRIGGAPSFRDFTNPTKSLFAVGTLLWLLLPPAELEKYPTPEDLHAAVNHDAEGEAIHAAIVGIVGDMSVDAEKKSTLKKSRSRKLNSD